jgi:hypothetical protein
MILIGSQGAVESNSSPRVLFGDGVNHFVRDDGKSDPDAYFDRWCSYESIFCGAFCNHLALCLKVRGKV